ncbi:YdbL family protein [Sphingomicrobium marinum]|uniref:YdbL family protein n=1 Tax=Sphingomicrobium marinum TaxID=1227950 RepID=UPI00223F9964|nr:YdbL family protein [Sphingomicrobium marinum]
MISLLALMLATQAPSASERVTIALADGRVGERYDGYLDFVVEPDLSTRRAVGNVNARRRALYTELGQRRNIAPERVGIYTGCRLMARVPQGGWYQLADRAWQQRIEGTPPPKPDYCPTANDAP